MHTKPLRNASPIQVFRHIVQANRRIARVCLREYTYIPLQTNAGHEKIRWLSRTDLFNDQLLREIIEKLPEKVELGVASKVQLDTGETVHVPMMDLNTTKSARGLTVVTERLKKVGIKSGWILETGKSYHYYGPRLLNKKDWIIFMGTCLLTSIVHNRENIEQVADPRYIGHSLKRGFTTLRIVTRVSKTFEPKVVHRIS